jgi:hypothetical protein
MKYARFGILALACAAASGCDGRSGRAFGDVNTVVVLAVDSLWAEVGDSVLHALEPRIFTTRSERTFEIEQMSPLDERWHQLRRFVQVVSIGVPGDGWIDPVVRAAPAQLPAIVENRDVWTGGQLVTALVVPPEQSAAAVLASLDSLASLLDGRFRNYTARRMFSSGADTVLRDSLRARAGYALTLPNLYQPVVANDSVRIFRTDTQIGGTLFRSIAVAQRTGASAPAAAELLDWRDRIAAQYYSNPEQATQRDTMLQTALPNGGVELQGIWRSTDAAYPEAGVFVTRGIACPAQNRVYLLDAWLLAPGRQKYEYLIQFQHILDSFECAGARN